MRHTLGYTQVPLAQVLLKDGEGAALHGERLGGVNRGEQYACIVQRLGDIDMVLAKILLADPRRLSWGKKKKKKMGK
jgi:hypothetical protein